MATNGLNNKNDFSTCHELWGISMAQECGEAADCFLGCCFATPYFFLDAAEIFHADMKNNTCIKPEYLMLAVCLILKTKD